jgi:D-alanyl-D-alanine carboxypeptidase/D-alanyl-D-alanine-endopeptidase (penicillin-binding protein 4)
MSGAPRFSKGVAAFVAVVACAAPPAFATDPAPKRVARALEPWLARPELAAAFWGVEVRSLSTGRALLSRNATQAFRPASTMKLVTTAAALDALGPEATLRTTVETAGRLDALGRVLGDVYLVGRGDPQIGSRATPGRPAGVFEEMAAALAAAGVKRVEGRLVGHEGAFSGDRRGGDWTWEDLAWGYATEVSALAFEDNVVVLRLAPGEREGDPAVLDLWPPCDTLAIRTTVATGTAGQPDSVRLEREPGSNVVTLSGSVPLGGEWRGELAVADPARHAAAAFAAALAGRGIRVRGPVVSSREALPEGARVLAAHESPPLADLVRAVNKESQNLHAEMLLRVVGMKQKGEGSEAQGHEAVVAFLDRLGVPHDGWRMTDGSGLARTDLVTPRGLVALLAAMDRHPAAAAFRASLPIAGRDGTLEKRMRGTAAEGNVTAKTGTLALVNALAGYVTTRGGERLAFALFVNNHAGRGREAVKALDKIAAALVSVR